MLHVFSQAHSCLELFQDDPEKFPFSLATKVLVFQYCEDGEGSFGTEKLRIQHFLADEADL